MWRESESPAFWGDTVGNVLAQTAVELEAAWKAESVADALEAWLTDASAKLLIELYPQAKSVLGRPPP
jgi:hypothetical protein